MWITLLNDTQLSLPGGHGTWGRGDSVDWFQFWEICILRGHGTQNAQIDLRTYPTILKGAEFISWQSQAQIFLQMPKKGIFQNGRQNFR